MEITKVRFNPEPQYQVFAAVDGDIVHNVYMEVAPGVYDLDQLAAWSRDGVPVPIRHNCFWSMPQGDYIIRAVESGPLPYTDRIWVELTLVAAAK